MDYNGSDFKALVFEYMSNGSLETWLHLVTGTEDRPRVLNLIEKLNIALNIAFSMHYLRDHCEQPIIHSDLKPSNVLLDKEMIAHVSDFRLAKILSNTTKFSQSQISMIGIKGTIRYAAPGNNPPTNFLQK